jgi:hypothetical protein
MEGTPITALPKRRSLLRIILWTLFIAFAVMSAWLGLQIHRAQKQRGSVASLERCGCLVFYDFQFANGREHNEDLEPIADARSSTPSWLLNMLGMDAFHSVVRVIVDHPAGDEPERALQFLSGLANVETLYLANFHTTDSEIANLASLANLQCLQMWEVAGITDEGIAQLAELKNLRQFTLTGSVLTDQSLKVFGKMSRLRLLQIRSNHFTDLGAESLTSLQDLERLALSGDRDGQNEISDAGIAKLQSLKKLNVLDLNNTKVTPAGVAAFQQAVPGCRVGSKQL